MTLKFDAFERKIQGDRPYQEDCCRFGARAPSTWHEQPGLAVLADGMGGEGRGDLAAKVVVDSFIRTFERSALDPPKRLRPALQSANAALDELKRSDPDLPSNMGCTLLAALVWNGRLYWISVGDSVLFLAEQGELRQLNEDHSRAAEVDRALAAGAIDAQAARLDPRRHQLASALVGREIPLIDECVTPVRLSAGDMVIVASDGVQTLSEKTLSDAIANAPGEGAEAAAHAVVRAVERAHDPDQDNATVMVIDIGMSAEPFDAAPARDNEPVHGTMPVSDKAPAEDDPGLFSRKLAQMPKLPELPPQPSVRTASPPADIQPIAIEPEPDIAAADPGFDLDDTPSDPPAPRLHQVDRFDPALISRAGTVALGLLVAAVTVFIMFQIADRNGTRTVVKRADPTTTGSTSAPTSSVRIEQASPEDTGDMPMAFPSPAEIQSFEGG